MSTKTPAESVIELGEEVNKGAIRQIVWDYIEKNDLVEFPRPCYRRIPNVKGAATAAEKMTSLDEFKKAQTVKINPDKPQENARFLTLEADKTLLVPTPRLRTGLFNKIVPPEGCNKDILRICATTQGVREHSEPIGLDTKIKVDLVVIGSVAVTKTGLRIGKGEGYADMEYAMMRSMEAVDENTVIITTVHDTQVVDFPESLIEDHDVVVDYIITPTEIIKCNRTRKNPSGIIWSKITPEKLRRVPILRKLLKREEAEGKDVTLKEGAPPPEIKTEDEGEESDRNYQRRPFYRRTRGGPRRPYNRRPRRDRNSENDTDGKGDIRDESEREAKSGDEENQRPRRQQQPRRRRFNRRRRNTSENKENEEPRSGDERRNRRSVGESDGADNDEGKSGDEGKPRRRRPQPQRRRFRPNNRRSEGDENEDQQGQSPRRRRGPPRTPIPTIFVGSVQRSVRVSELKSKIREKNVNPLRVIWNGAKCYALLQFPKMNEMEAAFDTLQDFEMNGKKLKIEISNRVKQYIDEEQNKGDGEAQVAVEDQAEN
ncbi:uncharacterized protein LOC143053441 [Mytilus galloprovincialis]|uniref:Methenyltetrahydrofolate synthase domain-containing protein n=1 Tax=Mytilus edulis TaxID=6550 RepID=A0A8S3SCC6_MYTED|nr:5-formyltetrahydrofolate cyclo-ligase-like protein COG0212,Methenyltetrahydrofolate synthase domain-containing protein [Mytilus edulis]